MKDILPEFELSADDKNKLRLFGVYFVIDALLRATIGKSSSTPGIMAMLDVIDIAFSIVVVVYVVRSWLQSRTTPADCGVAWNTATIVGFVLAIAFGGYFFSQATLSNLTPLTSLPILAGILGVLRDEVVLRAVLIAFLLGLFAQNKYKLAWACVISGIVYSVVFTGEMRIEVVAFIGFSFFYAVSRSVLITLLFVAMSQIPEEHTVFAVAVILAAYGAMLLLAKTIHLEQETEDGGLSEPQGG